MNPTLWYTDGANQVAVKFNLFEEKVTDILSNAVTSLLASCKLYASQMPLCPESNLTRISEKALCSNEISSLTLFSCQISNFTKDCVQTNLEDADLNFIDACNFSTGTSGATIAVGSIFVCFCLLCFLCVGVKAAVDHFHESTGAAGVIRHEPIEPAEPTYDGMTQAEFVNQQVEYGDSAYNARSRFNDWNFAH